MLYLSQTEGFIIKVTDTIEDAIPLLQIGFEYHCEVAGHKLFRKRGKL
jgi:hypothetical protein